MNDQPPPITPPLLASSPQVIPGLAIASLALGIISIVGGALLIIPMVLAIVFGHVSLSRIRKDQRLTGSGIAIAGLVLGYASIVFGILMSGLLAAMAIPAFQKVREESLKKMLQNDARQIAAAAQQVMLETGEQRVTFQIDPQTGTISGPLAAYVKQVSTGTVEVDGVFESAKDSFSLQNPKAYRGTEMVFDWEGKLSSKHP